VIYIGVQAFAENNIENVTIGENVEVNRDAFSDSFLDCYVLHNKLAGNYFRNQYGSWRAETRIRSENWYKIISTTSGNHENKLFADIGRTNGIFDSKPLLKIPVGQKYTVYLPATSAINLKDYPNHNVSSIRTSEGSYFLIIIDLGERSYITDEIITIEYQGLMYVNHIGIIQNKSNNVWLMHFSLE